MRVAAVARAVTECFGHAHSDIRLAHTATDDYHARPAADDYHARPDGNVEHGTGPRASTQHASTQHIRLAHALRDHGGTERCHGQAFKHHQDIEERHANGLGHLAKGDARADPRRPDHDG